MKASFLLSAVLGLFVTATIRAQANPAEQSIRFTDAEDGVSLDYPSTWKRIHRPDTYCPPAILTDDEKTPVRFGVEFTGKGTGYQKTTLEALVFLFARREHVSQKACANIATEFPQAASGHHDRAVPDPRFSYGHGGECGLNNWMDAQVYTRFSANRCYIFEEDFDYLGGAPAGMRDLTESEKLALLRQLNGIMRSVQIGSVTPPVKHP